MGIDISQLGKDAQAQVMAKMAVREVQKNQKPKRSKYGNRKSPRIMPNGETYEFDSEGEARRYDELKILLAMGKIRDLRLQVNFTLIEGYMTHEGKKIKPTVYRADFTYERPTEPDYTGRVIWLREVEDFKGMKTKDYLLKKKLMQDKYGITIREV